MSEWLNRFLYGLLPGRCILCTSLTGRYLDLCKDCEIDLPRTGNPCWQCALAIPNGQEICGRCLTNPPPFSHCFAAFEYAAPVDILINQFKNQQNIIVGKVMARILSRNYINQHILIPDMWLPVPLHKHRLKSRGFNQASEIAEVLSDATGVPINSRSCRRIHDTSDQKSKTAKQRALNMRNVFIVDENFNGQSIGIVDDVVTTMSTVAELSRLLLKHGAGEVQVVCLARTQRGFPS